MEEVKPLIKCRNSQEDPPREKVQFEVLTTVLPPTGINKTVDREHFGLKSHAKKGVLSLN
ncbi:MAG: hypothetical protein JWN25_1690 [Verrucomicrobiales bacterium]|nr:hypothetical protein [Verrucomicrobiales bacterium]